MHTRKIVGLSIRTPSSTASSPTTSTLDDDGDSTMPDCPSGRPLTVSIPKRATILHARKPNLSEILANTAPPPYSLSSFMAFLSQNHCLENLEFTMDAQRYRKHYAKMVSRQNGAPLSPLSDECAYVLRLWKRLIDAYIRESGPREVNLPAHVRDTLLNLTDTCIPPHPSTLDEAVSKIYELMEESVLVSFLNSVSPMSAYPASGHESQDGSLSRSQIRSYDERTHYTTRHQPAHQRASAPSSLAANFMHPRPFSHSRFNSQPATTSSGAPPVPRLVQGYTSGSDALTDDSSTGSPSGLNDPLTPPGTPPMSDYPMMPDLDQSYYETGSGATSTHHSPRTSRGEHVGLATATRDSWKRVSNKLWPKKKSGHLREEEQGVVEGGLF